MNCPNLNKYFNERIFLILSFITTLILLCLNIVGILILPSFLKSIIFAIFQYKNCFLALSITFLIFSFFNTVQDKSNKVRIMVLSSVPQILLKLFALLLITVFICIPTRFYDFQIYIILNTVLFVALLFLSFSIYFAGKNTHGINDKDNKFCLECGKKVEENQKSLFINVLCGIVFSILVYFIPSLIHKFGHSWLYVYCFAVIPLLLFATIISSGELYKNKIVSKSIMLSMLLSLVISVLFYSLIIFILHKGNYTFPMISNLLIVPVIILVFLTAFNRNEIKTFVLNNIRSEK